MYPDRVDEWKYGSLIIDKDGYWIKVNDDLTFKVVKETVGQLIGQKDINGEEIYEADILKCRNWGVQSNEVLSVSEVYWDEEEKGWRLSPDPTDGEAYDLFRNVEKIGTLYENPELIKTK